MAKNKQVEPVTVRSLAETIISDAFLCFSAGKNKELAIHNTEVVIAGHIRKPSDDDKLIPFKCAEAHAKAIQLLARGHRLMPDEYEDTRQWCKEVLGFINEPNPFNEAYITNNHEDSKHQPEFLPFDLKAAQNGSNVVTRDGRPAKILADDLSGEYPILAVITNFDGTRVSMNYRINGFYGIISSAEDLFILKEPAATHYINLYHSKKNGFYIGFAHSDSKEANKRALGDPNFIKTLIVQI